PGGVFELERAQHMLRGELKRNLEYQDLVLLEADGRVIASAREQTARLGLPLSPRFVRETLNQATPMMSVSAPAVNVATSERATYFVRPVDLGPGRRVLAVAEVPVSIITTILA